MKTLALLLVVATLSGGCAARKPGSTFGFLQHNSAADTLQQAQEMLGKGDSPGAARLLKGICAGGQQPGVTDEALFRLALLSLKPGE